MTRRRRNSTKAGGYPFTAKAAQYRRYSMDELNFARKDARDAARACTHDPIAEAWYMDDVATILAEINRRKNTAILRSNPDWADIRARFARGLGVAAKSGTRVAKRGAALAMTTAERAYLKHCIAMLEKAGYNVRKK